MLSIDIINSIIQGLQQIKTPENNPIHKAVEAEANIIATAVCNYLNRPRNDNDNVQIKFPKGFIDYYQLVVNNKVIGTMSRIIQNNRFLVTFIPEQINKPGFSASDMVVVAGNLFDQPFIPKPLHHEKNCSNPDLPGPECWRTTLRG